MATKKYYDSNLSKDGPVEGQYQWMLNDPTGHPTLTFVEQDPDEDEVEVDDDDLENMTHHEYQAFLKACHYILGKKRLPNGEEQWIGKVCRFIGTIAR